MFKNNANSSAGGVIPCVDCAGAALCYVRNDLPTPLEGVVSVSLLHYLSGEVTALGSSRVSLGPWNPLYAPYFAYHRGGYKTKGYPERVLQ